MAAVAQQPVELILLKQVAGYLAAPMLLVDPAGNLLYYNEPAEEILGHRYEETGQMPLDDWAAMFSPTDSLGRPVPTEELPLSVAVSERSPCQGSFWITPHDGIGRHLAVTALPLVGQGGTYLGALAVFWLLPRR